MTTTRLPSVSEVVDLLRPQEPILCIRPALVARTADRFVRAFCGEVLYAVKCNPEPIVLRALWTGGVRHFDCASLGEISLIRTLFPEASIHFMHPVKARQAVADAYQSYGVRDFAVDSLGELEKLTTIIGPVDDLGVIVRLELPPGAAVYDLSGKFGASIGEAISILRMARPLCTRLGVSFHVGSQCLDPSDYRLAIELSGRVVQSAGVEVDIIDVGGGFPVPYADVNPLPLDAFLDEIAVASARVGTRDLWAEPGRALVASGTSLVVQVQLRRGNALFINDGVYGTLSDAGGPGFRFPVRRIQRGGRPSTVLTPYRFFGPTCDSADQMKGPFWLPSDMAEGDWIEIGQVGAYGACLGSHFNGFAKPDIVEVRDDAMAETVEEEAIAA